MHGWDELLTLRVVRRLGEIVNRRWGLAVGVVDAAGQPVASGAFEVPRPLCDLLRAHPAGGPSCGSTPALLVELLQRREDAEDPAPVVWRCHAGLTVVAAPIRVDGELLGAVYAAGALSAEEGEAARAAVTDDVARFGLPVAQVEAAVAATPALTAEARDYLRELVALVVREILEYRAEAARRARTLAAATGPRRPGFEALVGHSDAMHRLFALVEKVSRADTTVLVTGENGTGKELVARAIHDNGPRALGPFVVLNCSALAPTLLESELFGHRKGSFTGAVADKKGLFEVADGGTLFLDEIGDTPPSLQVRLLRVLQEGVLMPVGDTRPVSVDVRIVAATHRDLAERVATGAFREDLFYRLNVITLRLPPLRERLEDLPVLVDHFLEGHAAGGRGRKRLTERALGRLNAYPWPGNVRELQNEIERLVVLSGDEATIDEQLLSPRIRGAGRGRRRSAAGRSLPEAVAELERRMLAEALETHRGNRTRAARALGISRRNLIRKIQRFDLEGDGETAT